MSRETQEERANRMESMIKDYQNAVGESTKSIGFIVAGPLKKNNKVLFRVKQDGREVIIPVLPSCTDELELNDEVMIVEDKILGLVDKELETKPNLLQYELSTWKDVIGLDHIVDDIKTSVQTLSLDNTIFADFGVKPVKGILLHGRPGNGKTLIGKAIASDILNSKTVHEHQFIFVKGGEMLDKYVGETEKRIVDMFKKAREYSKSTGERAVIFIDEADAILGKRSSMHMSSGMSTTVVPTFLSEMDGLEGHAPFVLLSTNLPDSLDEAVIRDGRIDQKIEIPAPDMNGTESLFNHYLGKIKCEDCEEIAKKATVLLFNVVPKEKISGAMVANIVNLSAKTAAIRYSLNKTTVKAVIWEDVEHCLNKLK